MAIFKYPNSCHVRDEAELFGIITDNREEALDLHHKSNQYYFVAREAWKNQVFAVMGLLSKGLK